MTSMVNCVHNTRCFTENSKTETTFTEKTNPSSMPYYFNKLAIELNNIAAKLIELNEFEDAHAILSDAIGAMKLSLRPNGIPNQRILKSLQSSPALLSSSVWKNPILVRAQFKLNEALSSSRRRRRTTKEYNQGLILPFDIPAIIDDTKEQQQEEDDERINFGMRRSSGNASEESAIILFNIALTEHLGSGLGQKDKRALERALKFYAMAQKTLFTLQEEDENNNSTTITSTTLFAMAIDNNMGQIYYEIGENMESRYCFDDLLQIHANSLEDNENNASISEMIDMFILNSMLLDMRPIASSAA